MQSQNLSLELKNIKPNSDRRLMLFDLSIYGHHPSYIQHFIKYWSQQEPLNNLDIVVSPKFIQEHTDVVKLAKEIHPNINFFAITPEEEANLKPRTSGVNRKIRSLQEWNLYIKYAEALQVTQALLMYFDTCQLPLALGWKSPCWFSGIYFRPTFHYSEFNNYTSSWKNWVQQRQEKLILKQVLRHPKLKTLFCLDPFAVKQINRFDATKAIYLPDPVVIHSSKDQFQVESLKRKLGIEPNRKVFLLFGALNGRKGIYQLLESIQLLPSTGCEQICLLFVGEANPTDKALIQSQVAATRQSHPVQIIEHYEFVAESEIPTYFQIADVVLAPYQRHVGMSGILLLAAAAAKPVLSSNYGLMGEIVRNYRLGITVDSSTPAAIAKGLEQCLAANPKELSDRNQMQLFAEQNSAEKFANLLFQHA